MKKRVVELFAGVGGFRIGLQNSSSKWDFVWANQWEPSRKQQDAFNCYINHFGNNENHSNEDINIVDKTKIPDHELLVGGFPCQDYSVAKTGAEGIQGKKGVLWWSIYEILKLKHPSFILLENVDRLLKSPAKQRGKDFGIILSCLNQLSYSVEWRIINAADYGFPQRRRRVFIFAYKNNTFYFSRYKKYHNADLVKKYGFFQSLFSTTSKNLFAENQLNSDDLIKISENFSMKFFNSGVMRNGKIYTEELVPDVLPEITQLTINDVLEKNVSEKYKLNGELSDWEYMKGSKRIERIHKDGHKYVFAEGGIAFPDPINKPSRTMLTSEFSKNRSTHIIKDPETKTLRKLTPIECERLNGFPDNWTNTGMSERFRYFCMGNALIVGLVDIMGRKLNELIDEEN